MIDRLTQQIAELDRLLLQLRRRCCTHNVCCILVYTLTEGRVRFFAGCRSTGQLGHTFTVYMGNTPGAQQWQRYWMLGSKVDMWMLCYLGEKLPFGTSINHDPTDLTKEPSGGKTNQRCGRQNSSQLQSPIKLRACSYAASSHLSRPAPAETRYPIPSSRLCESRGTRLMEGPKWTISLRNGWPHGFSLQLSAPEPCLLVSTTSDNAYRNSIQCDRPGAC